MSTIQQDFGLTDEQFGKLRLFNRILISYNDFKQAHEIASLAATSTAITRGRTGISLLR